MKQFLRKIWDALVRLISKVPYDKYLHFIMGLLLTAAAYIFFGWKACIIPAVVAGLLKEAFDKWTTGQWDWWDFVATVCGGLIIQLFVVLALVLQ